ncbi:diadenosine tetraphosphate hydrolase [bacterium CG_4_10_14_0_2_um_filter_33_32]|nr:MAG: hypothetical protein AUJ93_03050 [bacterium CG2_30_33_46]PIR67723.1 MAG: diadenosine tetraphosphate hydrolase [bacterium CG10_big_fil_rev_8_21_14_0_10_33_18]PIU76365.1 MAG: diadenosine tetraphosphate hydrolase [bacterium CG06_land_8_20_14_3_00_33_50]PIW81576.1 MAG: diadenosine tetraphosphate hydrolase [bacterium CG_4_8_14_3_um_filter_33_28]PIY85147.1 MAG: diadenosine tetraphosphate hydrolase [bacterium CG_4_10_14_0_8_um_filter_33_57]PIZ86415.1 MAG: diadenosine tetraphosphate hydrolase 
MTTNCIFCKIINNEIPSVKIWEDDRYIAILDINPNTEGVTLVLSKRHEDSYLFDLDDDIVKDIMIASKKVAKILEKGLGVHRVAMVMEGMGINHLHIKLYPLHGIDDKFVEMWAGERKYFDKYEGYLSTQLGPEKSLDDLKKVLSKINKNINK